MLNSNRVMICWLTAMGMAFPLTSLAAPKPKIGDDVLKAYEAHEFRRGEQTLPYRLLRPIKQEQSKRYSLVLFLHGAGERGDDNTAQLVHVAPELADQELRERYPAFVVAPQCPKEIKWVDVEWGSTAHDMQKSPSQPLSLVIDMMDSLIEELPIDPDRVYVIGLSMGGYGTWELLQRIPERFVAGVPICGGGDPAYARKVAQVPVWAFHGDADQTVPVERSRNMIQAVRAAGGTAIYTEYPGVSHNSWTMTAQNRLVWDWLFSHERSSSESRNDSH